MPADAGGDRQNYSNGGEVTTLNGAFIFLRPPTHVIIIKTPCRKAECFYMNYYIENWNTLIREIRQWNQMIPILTS